MLVIGKKTLQVLSKNKFANKSKVKAKQKKPLNVAGVKQYNCPNCSFKTLSFNSFHVHRLKHNRKEDLLKSSVPKSGPKQETPNHCPACSFSTCDKDEMISHFTRHESQVSCLTEKSGFYQCCHCAFRTKVKREMENHLINQANNKKHFINGVTCEYPQLFRCDICGAMIKGLERFEVHRQYMHVHNIQCKKCNKRFSNCNALLNHAKSHTD